MRATFLFIIASIFALCSGQAPSIPVPVNNQQWLVRHNGFVSNTAANPGIPIIFYGDSITDFWARQGLPVYNHYYAPLGVTNYGISGDRTQHLIWRIQNGEVDGLNSKLVVLKIGTNNLGSDSENDIARGILTIVQTLITRLPNTRILLLSILPRNGVANYDKIKTINSLIAQFRDGQNVFYLDIFDKFTGSIWGSVNGTLFTDGLHLTEAGYQLWAELMNPLIDRLIQLDGTCKSY